VTAAPGALLWDFDGTLARRPGMWRGCLLQVLDADDPEHGVPEDVLGDGLRDGFPWHRPDQPHPHLNEPDSWWADIEELMARSYRSAGIAPARARELAGRAHALYVDHRDGWELYDEAVEVLGRFRTEGWRNVILSNHVPELPEIVARLGLDGVVAAVITSAAIGYEKPHPAAFAVAREVAGDVDRLWMIGDNPVTDVGGAEAAGIPAIRVHGEPGPGRWSADLRGVRRYITPEPGSS
jgi:putative hydrolase of the HAD superfamily